MGRMRTMATCVALASALIAAGCSSDDEPAEGEAQQPASASGVSDDQAVIDAWASLVAQQQVAYDDLQGKWDDATCSSATAADGAVDCQAMMLSMGHIGDLASATFWDASDPDSDNYLGDPPAQVADLTEKTAEAADDVSVTAMDVTPDCFDGDCTSAAVELERAWDALGVAYAGWKPYL